MIAQEVFAGHAPDKDNAAYVVCAAESLSSFCCSALFSSYPRVRRDLVPGTKDHQSAEHSHACCVRQANRWQWCFGASHFGMEPHHTEVLAPDLGEQLRE